MARLAEPPSRRLPLSEGCALNYDVSVVRAARKSRLSEVSKIIREAQMNGTSAESVTLQILAMLYVEG